MDERGLRWPVGVAAALVATHATWLALQLGGPDGTQAFSDLFLVAVPLAAAAACLHAARTRPQARRAWLLLGASAASWAAGNVVWTFYELGLGRDVPFPSAADVGYLAAIPLAAAGLLSIPAAREAPAVRRRLLLDGSIVASSLLFISWAFVLGPSYQAASGSAFEQAIGLAYPVGDVALVTIVVVTTLRSPAAGRLTWSLLAAGFLAIAASDVTFAWLTTHEMYASGTFADVGWAAGYLLLAVAAIRAATVGVPGTEAEPALTAYRTAVPYAPVVAAIGVAIGKQLTVGALEPFLFWNAVVVVSLVVGRQLLTLRELQEESARRQELEAARRAMLGTIVHDLGTPLSTIKVQSHLLRVADPSPEATRRLGILDRNTDHIQHLVADLRDVSHLETGAFRIEPRPVSVDALVAQAVETLHEAAAARGVAIRFQPAAAGDVLADPERVAQVLLNLLGNAVKFSAAGTTVDVSVAAAAGAVEVRVRDAGPGLTPEQRARLFRPFSRVHDPSTKVAGTGLGLYIARGIVERHGGAIWCESDGPGTGSTFAFTLPLAEPKRSDGAAHPHAAPAP